MPQSRSPCGNAASWSEFNQVHETAYYRCHSSAHYYRRGRTDRLHNADKPGSAALASTSNPCLMTRMFSYIPQWMRHRRNLPHTTLIKTVSHHCIRGHINLPEDSDEGIIHAKKRILQAENIARKMTTESKKVRRQTYKRYKIKAKEIEKQVENMEKEKIKQKREALRQLNRLERENLMRERELLRVKEILQRTELRNREKNVRKHVKNLRRKLRAKCESIYYDSEEVTSSAMLSLERLHKCEQERKSGRKHEEERSDVDIARILNKVLDTNIDFDPTIIARTKTLLNKNSQLRCCFDEFRQNNKLTHQLKCKLFNRIGLDSKLKLFLRNLSDENTELLLSILDQVHKGGEAQPRVEETALGKIRKVLWNPGNVAATEPTSRDPSVKMSSGPVNAQVEAKRERGERKLQTKTKEHRNHRSVRPVNSIELTKKKLAGPRQPKPRQGQKQPQAGQGPRQPPRVQRQSRGKQMVELGRTMLTKKMYGQPRKDHQEIAGISRLHSGESEKTIELKEKAVITDTIETRKESSATKFNLWQYFTKTPSTQTDSATEVSCIRCTKATATDFDSEFISDSEVEGKLYHDSDGGDTDKDRKKPGCKLWTLFNRKDKSSGDDSSDGTSGRLVSNRNRQRSVWTNRYN